jgi:hypothetical protein
MDGKYDAGPFTFVSSVMLQAPLFATECRWTLLVFNYELKARMAVQSSGRTIPTT